MWILQLFKVCPYSGCDLLDSEDSNKCCNYGKVDLADKYKALQDRPEELQELLENKDPILSKEFLDNSHTYNRLHAFGVIEMTKEDVGAGIPAIKVFLINIYLQL